MYDDPASKPLNSVQGSNVIRVPHSTAIVQFGEDSTVIANNIAYMVHITWCKYSYIIHPHTHPHTHVLTHVHTQTHANTHVHTPEL